jgi:type II secretory pathway component PulF
MPIGIIDTVGIVYDMCVFLFSWYFLMVVLVLFGLYLLGVYLKKYAWQQMSMCAFCVGFPHF